MSFKRFNHLGAGWHVVPQADDVRGFQVFDSAGKFIGIVDDLLVDAGDNKTIGYALVGEGNIATMFNHKELIVPLNKLDIDSNNKSIHLNVPFDQLWDFPGYDTLADPDLKDEVDSFWASILSAPVFRHDVTVRHPSTLASPVPIPSKVEPSKMPAGNPRIVAGLESPISQEVVDRAVASVAARESRPSEEPAKEPEVKMLKPEKEEERREKPAA